MREKRSGKMFPDWENLIISQALGRMHYKVP
jgi:hypothetical protein